MSIAGGSEHRARLSNHETAGLTSRQSWRGHALDGAEPLCALLQARAPVDRRRFRGAFCE
jgi:hypothetical protein